MSRAAGGGLTEDMTTRTTTLTAATLTTGLLAGSFHVFACDTEGVPSRGGRTPPARARRKPARPSYTSAYFESAAGSNASR